MIEKTVTDIFSSSIENSVIFLNANTLGFGATGLFRRLRLEFPNIFDDYHQYCVLFKDKRLQEECIGKFYAIPFQNNSVICFSFGQRFFSETKYELDIEAFETNLRKVAKQIKTHAQQTGVLNDLHIPYKIGNGMSPEEVEKAHQIIEQIFDDSPIKVIYHI